MTVGNFYVYMHSRLKSGEPFYVGKGRGARAYADRSRSPYWKNITAKDGGFYANIIVGGLDEELAFLVEMEAIDRYRRLGVKLSNLTNGGEGISGYRFPNGAHNKGKPCSDEIKIRISKTLKEKGCLPPVGWNKGKLTARDIRDKMTASQLARWAEIKRRGGVSVSDDTRAKQRAAKLGRALPEETKRRLSEALKANKYIRSHPDMTGYKHSPETRAKMSASKRGKKARNRKAVGCVDTGEVFESAAAAAKRFGRNGHTLIAACCRGLVSKAYGHQFQYVADHG